MARTEVILLEKIYGPFRDQAIQSLKHIIKRKIGSLDARIVDVSIADNKRNYVKVVIEGEDAEVAANYLRMEYQSIKSFDEISEGDVLRGRIIDSEEFGYGIYVDIGVVKPVPKDALLPLYKLRKQLVASAKVPLRQISQKFALIDNLPVEIKIVDINNVNMEIEAEISENQLKTIKRWVRSGLERVIVCGAPRQTVRKAIIRTGHLRDIIRIERLGLLEHAIVCKRGTTAPGIIAEIGNELPGVVLKAFRPIEIKEWFKTLE